MKTTFLNSPLLMFLFLSLSWSITGITGCKDSSSPKAAAPPAVAQGATPGDVMTPPPTTDPMNATRDATPVADMQVPAVAPPAAPLPPLVAEETLEKSQVGAGEWKFVKKLAVRSTAEVDYSPDGRRAAIVNDGIEVLDLGTWESVRTIPGHSLHHARFDREGKRLGYFQGQTDFSHSQEEKTIDATAFIMDLETGELTEQLRTLNVRSKPNGYDQVNGFAFVGGFSSGLDRFLVMKPGAMSLGSDYHGVTVSSLDGKKRHTLNALDAFAAILSIRARFSPDDRYVLVITEKFEISFGHPLNKTVEIYPTGGEEAIAKFTPGPCRLAQGGLAACHAPDRERDGRRGFHQVWRLGKPEPILEVSTTFQLAELSRDGKTLVLTRDQELWFVSLPSGKVSLRLRLLARANRVFLSPDGKTLAALWVHHDPGTPAELHFWSTAPAAATPAPAEAPGSEPPTSEPPPAIRPPAVEPPPAPPPPASQGMVP